MGTEPPLGNTDSIKQIPRHCRHEVPVSAATIRLVSMTEDLVVVDKPASIPVHPCGRYRHNTIVFILAKEAGLKNLRTIHRSEHSEEILSPIRIQL